jgi:hypothetical protein
MLISNFLMLQVLEPLELCCQSLIERWGNKRIADGSLLDFIDKYHAFGSGEAGNLTGVLECHMDDAIEARHQNPPRHWTISWLVRGSV